MNYIWPTESQNKQFAEQVSESGTVTMLNLLRYREQAQYKDTNEEVPCSGGEAYKRYAQRVFPILKSYNAKLIFAGAAMSTVIGPDAENWDDVLIVEYPSRHAFMEMTSSAEYLAVSHHREAALADSRLVSMGTASLGYDTA